MDNKLDLFGQDTASRGIGTTPSRVELAMPSFGQWVKAGMGFTLGAGLVTIIGGLLWFVIVLGGIAAIGAAITSSRGQQRSAIHEPIRR